MKKVLTYLAPITRFLSTRSPFTYMITGFVLLFLIVWMYSADPLRRVSIGSMTVGEGLVKVAEVAAGYKAQTGNYGFMGTERSSSCFEPNTFLRTPAIESVFAERGVEDVSCRLQSEAGAITAWSVTLVANGKAYCTDSAGESSQTPGITLTVSCTGE